MTEWRFCGQFNPWTQDAITDDLSWIDEKEALRRYVATGERLTAVPRVDQKTGIVPYFVVITPGEHPSFTVVRQTSPAFGVGARISDSWWKNLGDGRLFQDIATAYEYGPYDPTLPAQAYKPVSKVQSHNNEDGTGWKTIQEFNPRSRMRADRDSIPVDELYAPVPSRGEWDALVF